MNEFDHTNKEHLSLRALQQFDADILYSKTYDELLISLKQYLTEDFPITSTEVHNVFFENGVILPTNELFEFNPDAARESARLVLMKLALPLAENLIDNENSFRAWTTNAAKVAMNIDRPGHNLDECMTVSRIENAPHSCATSMQCPVKITAYTLIKEASRADFGSLDYCEPWHLQKISRTISKIEVARDLNLIGNDSTNSIVQSYFRHWRESKQRHPTSNYV